MIARFAQDVSPAADEKPDPQREKRASLVARRRQLIAMRTAEANRLQQAADPAVRQSIQRVLDLLDRQIAELDQQIEQAIHRDQKARDLDRKPQSVDGVGTVVAHTLINELPELGRVDRRKITAPVGLAPYNRDSGKQRGRLAIRGGRAQVRRALYMGALTATRCNSAIRPFYQRLRGKGKSHKTAMTACMRKMLIHLNNLVREPNHSPASG